MNRWNHMALGIWMGVILLGLAGWQSLQAEEAAPEALALRDQMLEAYRKLERYESTGSIAVSQSKEREWQTRRARVTVALDRGQSSLLATAPDYALSVQAGKLRVTSRLVPSRHLDMPFPQLTFAALNQALPELLEPAAPDLILLTAENPLPQLLGNLAQVPPQLVRTEQATAKLVYAQGEEKIEITIDPKTKLATQWSHRTKQGDAVELSTWVFHPATPDQWPATAFTLAPRLTESVDSFQQFVAAAEELHPLADMPAPKIQLATVAGGQFDLATAPEKVIVLDFWATWCPPCRAGLPKLEEFQNWAKENQKSVGVYTVNLRETPQQVQAFWRQMGLTLPVLMDVDGSVGDAYAVEGIPQTVMIADGKVQRVWVGLVPDMEKQMRTLSEHLLKAAD